MKLHKNIKNKILNIKILLKEAEKDIESISNVSMLEKIKSKVLGKQSFLTLEINSLKELSKEDRPIIGECINFAKKNIIKKLIEKKIYIDLKQEEKKRVNDIDISLSGRINDNGTLHPITQTIFLVEKFFTSLGFDIVSGNEIEDAVHNFDALNISKNHPARTNHDTFWFDTVRLLRTQTSAVQIRTMKKKEPPIRIITSGRVYRHDNDPTHTPMFHQLEGLIVDYNINFSNLKATLMHFLYNFFEQELKIRFRPSYFPFTEPSAEVDILYKDHHWLEILGCGMVHPNVLSKVGINIVTHSGFAFGIGIERLAMLRYGIHDLRLFFENDLRFLKQFK